MVFGGYGISGLGLADISLNAGGIGVQAVLLTCTSNTQYTLSVSGITAEGDVSVSVNKASYAFKPASRTVTVRQTGTPVTMTAAQIGDSAVAGASATTTGLELAFDTDIRTLAKSELKLTARDAQNNGIATGTLTGNASPYALAVSGIKKTGNVTVSVTKSGYSILSQTAPVYYAEEVAFTEVTANGQLDTTPTTQLTLTFDKSVPLTAGNITITPNGTGAQKEMLSGGPAEYTLGLKNVTQSGNIGVTVTSPAGYNITARRNSV